MTIAAGELNRYVLIEKREVALDALNAPVDTWIPHASFWASIRGQTGMGAIKASTEAGVVKSISRYSFRCRYRNDIDIGMRVNLKGQLFDIKQITHDLDRREWTDIVCEAGGNDG